MLKTKLKNLKKKKVIKMNEYAKDIVMRYIAVFLSGMAIGISICNILLGILLGG